MLREQLAVMQQVASNLLDYLEKHPKAIPAARRFIDTYQDRAANLAEEYRELEKTGLDTEQVADTRANIKETLFSFDEAYEKEFERVLGDKLLDLTVEQRSRLTKMGDKSEAFCRQALITGRQNAGKLPTDAAADLTAEEADLAEFLFEKACKSVEKLRGNKRRLFTELEESGDEDAESVYAYFVFTGLEGPNHD